MSGAFETHLSSARRELILGLQSSKLETALKSRDSPCVATVFCLGHWRDAGLQQLHPLSGNEWPVMRISNPGCVGALVGRFFFIKNKSKVLGWPSQ